MFSSNFATQTTYGARARRKAAKKRAPASGAESPAQEQYAHDHESHSPQQQATGSLSRRSRQLGDSLVAHAGSRPRKPPARHVSARITAKRVDRFPWTKKNGSQQRIPTLNV